MSISVGALQSSPGANLGPLYTVSAALTLTVSDTLSLSDVISGIGKGYAVSDTLTLSDAAAIGSPTLVIQILDLFSFTDSQQWFLSGGLGETFGFNDNV